MKSYTDTPARDGRAAATIPGGKGNAVREGFEHATGAIILIQDADLEYTVDDYPACSQPIIDGRADFTLGCRHVRGHPMRIMADTRVRATHRQRRSLGVHGDVRRHVRHAAARPVHDVQGVPVGVHRRRGVRVGPIRLRLGAAGKLVRLGYRPLEVPVEYNARSFEEGKKVRFFRDPPTWVGACIRFRFSPLPRQGDLLAPQSAERGDQIARRRGELVSDRHSDAMEG